MKRIAIVSAMNFNNNSAGSKRVSSYAFALSPKVDRIYLISLYTPYNKDGFLFDRKGSNIFSYSKDKDNIRSIRSMIVFFKNLRKFINTEPKLKVILYPSSFFIFDLLIILFLYFKKVSLYIELNEVRKYNLYSDRSKYKTIKDLFSYSVYSFMDYAYRLSTGHIYISTTIANYYNKRRSIIIPILCNTKNKPIKNIKKYSDSEIFEIGFAGSIDPKKEKMDTFFKSIQRIILDYPNLRVNLYGRIPNKEKFFLLLEKYGINEKFIFKEMIDQKELIKTLQKDNHLLILPRGFTKQNYYGFSTKLSEYLEAQLPILTSTVGDIGKYFIDMENSFTYIPDDVDSLTEKLKYVISNYNSITPIIIKGGDKLVNNVFHYSNYSDLLYSFLFEERND